MPKNIWMVKGKRKLQAKIFLDCHKKFFWHSKYFPISCLANGYMYVSTSSTFQKIINTWYEARVLNVLSSLFC